MWSYFLIRFKEYAGTIVVNRSENGKMIYSLILEDNPESLEFKEEVAFKIVVSAESFNLE